MSTETVNYNLALGSNYKLELSNSKSLNYFVQTVSLPGITMDKVAANYMNHSVWVQGEHIEYEDLTLTFLVDEDYTNYLYLFNWIHYDRDNQIIVDAMQDITLHILKNSKTPNLKITFNKAFPTTIGSLELSNANSDTEPLVCQVTFAYQFFEFSNESIN